MPSTSTHFECFLSPRCASAIRERVPALAVVVGAHQDHHVFHANDQSERPEDERQHAQNLQAVDHAVFSQRGGGSLSESIERACADVAEDDAERPKGQHVDAWLNGPAMRAGIRPVAGRIC